MDTTTNKPKKFKIKRKKVGSASSVSTDKTSTSAKGTKRRFKIKKKKTKTSTSSSTIDISSLSDTMSSFLVSSEKASSSVSEEIKAKGMEDLLSAQTTPLRINTYSMNIIVPFSDNSVLKAKANLEASISDNLENI